MFDERIAMEGEEVSELFSYAKKMELSSEEVGSKEKGMMPLETKSTSLGDKEIFQKAIHPSGEANGYALRNGAGFPSLIKR
jgi:hypothetical protein